MNPRRLTLLASFALVACASMPSGPVPFTTDGCSLFPDRALVGSADWCVCCLVHDVAYWRGGTEEERLNADRELRACVQQKTGNHALAEAMFLGVRAGGGPQAATPFRWGYAWPYGRGYRAVTEDEAASLQVLEDRYRAANPQLQCRTSKDAQAAASPAACPRGRG